MGWKEIRTTALRPAPVVNAACCPWPLAGFSFQGKVLLPSFQSSQGQSRGAAFSVFQSRLPRSLWGRSAVLLCSPSNEEGSSGDHSTGFMPVLFVDCQQICPVSLWFCFVPDFGGQREWFEEELMKVTVGLLWESGQCGSMKGGGSHSHSLGQKK